MAGISQRLKVKLKGGGPWGFRLLGGAGTGLPLTVAKIRRKSKSYKNLQEGDLFIKVNDAPCNNLTYEQVMSIADKSGTELFLEIERKGTVVENVCHNRANDYVYSSDPVYPAQSKVKDSSLQIPSENDIQNAIKQTEETRTLVNNKEKSEETGINFNTADAVCNSVLVTSNTIVTDSVKDEPKQNTYEAMANGCTLKTISTEKPIVESDITSKTTAEITPTKERFERIQTEKLHEKDENSETTIIRTDCQELIKSQEKTTSIPEAVMAAPLEELAKELENSFLSAKHELYECTTSEKTEVTTTTEVNGFIHQLNSNLTEKLQTSAVPQTTSVFPSDTFISSSGTADPVRSSDSFFKCEDPFGAAMAKKKKNYSSSSFYEEPHAIYPTMEEQFEMAKKIADSLGEDTNKKSKGANMFFKRAKRSTKWIHEGPEPSSESAPTTPDVATEPFYPEYYVDENQRNGPKLKLVLDPRHPIDAASLRSTGHKISEHNVSHQICHGLVKDLESPKGKGSALFAKRKKKSSEWVVDEEKVRSLMKSQDKNLEQLIQNTSKENIAPFKLPYDSFKLPSKCYDTLHNRINPERLAETVIQAADCKRRDSIQSNEEQRFESCRSPIIPATPAASYFDIYKAKAPTGWSSPLVEKTPHIGAVSGFPEIADYPSFNTVSSSTNLNKYQFKNFNTLPRKWKSP